MPLLWWSLAGSTKRRPKSKPHLRSILTSPCGAIGTASKAIIRLFSKGASGSSRTCARPGCPKDERDPQTRDDSGRRRGRLQPARRRRRGSHLVAAPRAVQNDGYGADSGPSRGDPGRRAFRSLEISPIAGASADPALYVDLVTTPRYRLTTARAISSR